jgi:hypothetical protein
MTTIVIDSGHYVARAVFSDKTGLCTDSAPIIKWMVGRTIDSIIRYIENKGYKYTVLSDPT